MAELNQIATKLSAASLKRLSNPYTEFEWPERLDSDKWQFSPDLISLYGTDIYNSLDERQLKLLAFWEAVNFFSINIHGERALIQGLAGRLYKQWPVAISAYLHHFLDEENKHMTVFGTYCERYGHKVYPDKKLYIPTEYTEGEEDFLFFAKVVIFEELVDAYNSKMGSDDRLDELARHINHYHHNDESRHLAFGREITKELFAQYETQWDQATLTRVRQYLADYIVATWREYYNPAVYRDAGLDDTYELYQSALDSPICKKHRETISAKCIKFFIDSGILVHAPSV